MAFVPINVIKCLGGVLSKSLHNDVEGTSRPAIFLSKVEIIPTAPNSQECSLGGLIDVERAGVFVICIDNANVNASLICNKSRLRARYTGCKGVAIIVTENALSQAESGKCPIV